MTNSPFSVNRVVGDARMLVDISSVRCVYLAAALSESVDTAMSEYVAAVERAQSRAAVLQSLQDSYGKKSTVGGDVKVVTNTKQKGKTGTSAPAAETASFSDKGLINDVVESLLGAIGDQTMRTKQFFKDSLRGKAIVIENLKSQLEAAKGSKKLERASKRKLTVSNRQMKRLCIGEPSLLPSRTEVTALHDTWWDYATQVVDSTGSEAQLQAR